MPLMVNWARHKLPWLWCDCSGGSLHWPKSPLCHRGRKQVVFDVFTRLVLCCYCTVERRELGRSFLFLMNSFFFFFLIGWSIFFREKCSENIPVLIIGYTLMFFSWTMTVFVLKTNLFFVFLAIFFQTTFPFFYCIFLFVWELATIN